MSFIPFFYTFVADKRKRQTISVLALILFLSIFNACNLRNHTEIKIIKNNMKYNQLTEEERQVIINKATERPFTGKLLNNKEKGTYLCKQCNASLYHSEDKFESHCGWPSFDDEIKGAVKRVPDADGRRTEIVCANCGGHLGHVFLGEGFTAKNTRHCVNSISMRFVGAKKEIHKTPQLDTAYFASGCFWGTEYHFIKAKGVQSTAVGYMGGKTQQPTYKEVCRGTTGHLETVEVVFDTEKTDYEKMVKLFFETHDFTQTNGQGLDIGSQYLSAIFYKDNEQYEIAKKLIAVLEEKGYKVATKLIYSEGKPFWKAENYHQQYYQRKGEIPYCHIYQKIF